MIVENTTRFELRERWNRHLRQNVLEVKIDSEWRILGGLVVGSQNFDHGINAFTELPRSAQRSDCDLQTGRTTLSEAC